MLINLLLSLPVWMGWLAIDSQHLHGVPWNIVNVKVVTYWQLLLIDACTLRNVHTCQLSYYLMVWLDWAVMV